MDDAAVLEAGQCQTEAWSELPTRRPLHHAGLACRVLAIDLGVSLDRLRHEDGRYDLTWGPQIKWATELSPTISLGLVWSAAQNRPAEQPAWTTTGHQLLAPLTWKVSDVLDVHLNVGHVFRPGARHLTSRGAAVEWKALERWTGQLEYFHDGQYRLWQAGLRWQAAEAVSLDLLRAHRPEAGRRHWWTLGLNVEFGR